jgi:hypothetical protein
MEGRSVGLLKRITAVTLIMLASLVSALGAIAPVEVDGQGEAAAQTAQQSQARERRESLVPVQPGPPLKTGPASTFQALEPQIDPVFGPNYRANTDTQTPNFAQQEPSIAVNPTNPLNVVVAAKDEREGTNTKHVYIYTSTDGGVSWLNQRFPYRQPPPPFSSDPVVNFADDGLLYVTSLPYGGGTSGIQVTRSTDGGITFLPASQVTSNPNSDKEWTWVDNNPASPFYHRVYVAWRNFGSGPDIVLNYSTDRGVTWSADSQVASFAYQFPMPVTLPNGDVLVTFQPGSNTVGYARSTDGGVTFGPVQTIAPLTYPECPPDNAGCGIWRLNPIPSTAVNPNNGNAVIMWADGLDSRATILYSRSSDNGATWSTAARLAPSPVNDTYQVEPWVEADEEGTFHSIWYDDRDAPNTSIFHILYSQSTDNGVTWSQPARISTAASDLKIGIPTGYGLAAGDYIQVTASHGNVYAAWTDTRSGTGEDIYVVRGTWSGGTPTPAPTSTPCPTPGYSALIVHADGEGAAPTLLQSELLAEPDIIVANLFDARGTTPTLGQLQVYDFVFTFSYSTYANPVAMGNVLADYLDSGGIVLASFYSFHAHPTLGIQGRWFSGGYSPYNYTFGILSDNPPLGNHDPQHPLMQGVSTLVAGPRLAVTTAPGATQVAAYTDGSSAVAVKGRAIGIPSYLGNVGNRGTGHYARVIANAGRWLRPRGCPTATPTSIVPTSTRTSTAVPSTPTRTGTSVPTSTGAASPTTTIPASATAAGTFTPITTATATTCATSFSDVPPGHTFYANIMCLACRGIISGYADGTFRPGNDITRGQIAKMVANAAGFQEPVSGQTYEDVPLSHTFYDFIERLSQRGHMGGYPCGLRDTEPCNPPENRPYLRPFENATRGQLSKIVANALGILPPVSGIFYTDVQEDNPFYVEIMRLTDRGVMSGYPCGGVNPQTGQPETCDEQSRPYFRWGNNVTRGQASKIVANAFFPNCVTP